jgi:TonB family protein
MSRSGTAVIRPPAGGGYVLRSDLAQYCLPAANRDEARPLAWANAIALMFVGIACLGVRGPVFVIRELPKLDEPMPPVIVQVQDVKPPEPEELSLDEPPPEVVDTPVATVVVAVADPTTVNFAVPAVGNVQIVNSGAYAAPPPAEPQRYVPPTAPSIKNIRLGGNEFRSQAFKAPDQLFQRGQQGTATLLITVGENGVPSEVIVEKGTGYPELDRHTVEQVKRWVADVGPVRNYRISIALRPF